MKNTAGFITLSLAAALTGLGLYLGQHTDVLTKAVRICMECVGIG